MKRMLFTGLFSIVLIPTLVASRETRLLDNGNGTITDNATCLMWQKDDSDIPCDWEGALAYCEDLEFAGHDDWRLPDIKELKSIVDTTAYDPAIDSTYFSNAKPSYYWSGSTVVYSNELAWVVIFHYGHIDRDFKYNDIYVRCVR